MDNNHQQKMWVAWLVVLVFILAIGLRVNGAKADLPSHITFSGSILTDEGNQCHNSRSKVLYGEWFPDDWRITNYNPILPYIKLGIFKLLGVGMWQLRTVNYLFAFFTILFFYLTLRSLFSPQRGLAILGTLFLSTNFLYTMYNKIATFETTLIFWIILCIYFLEKYRARKQLLFFLAATAAAYMGFVFKTLMAYLIPVPFIAFILYLLFPSDNNTPQAPSRARFWIRTLIFGIAGVLLVAIPWYFLHYLPNREWILHGPGQFMGNLIIPKTLSQAWTNFLHFNWKDQFFKMPIIWLGSILYLPVFFRRILHRKAWLTEIAFVTFFFAHTFFFFIVYYRPTRYMIPVIPAMVFMTIMLFRQLQVPSQTDQKTLSPVWKATLYLLDTAWLMVALVFCFIPLFSRYIYHVSLPRPSILIFAISAFLTAAVYLFKKWNSWGPWLTLTTRRMALPLLLLMTGLSLAVDAHYYLDWNRHKTYTIRDMSLEMKEKLDHAYICGMTSSVAILENRHKTLWLYPNFTNWYDSVLDKYGITHALIANDLSQEIPIYFKQWPQRMNQAALLKTYHIKNYFLHFYSFVNPVITDGVWESPTRIRLLVHNPTTSKIATHIDLAFLPKQGEIERRPGKILETLAPGQSTLIIDLETPPPQGDSLLLSLDCNRSYNDYKPLRYEGEMFSSRCGSDRYNDQASNGSIRGWVGGKDQPGYLAYGPAVPFAPGVFLVDFKLSVGRVSNKTQPLCRLDIFSKQENQSLAERSLLFRDFKKSTDQTFHLETTLRDTRSLEFRVEALGQSDIDFDYVDVTYLQGYFLDPLLPQK